MSERPKTSLAAPSRNQESRWSSSRIFVGGGSIDTERHTLPTFLIHGRQTVKQVQKISSEISLAESATQLDWPSICAHLPDILMSMDHTQLPSEMTFQCVVFFLDISGFTALCETYSNAGKTGTDQLINTLNSYIGALVAEILAYDGDILKFAGDAILAVWYADNFDAMQTAVAHALECALDVQNKQGAYLTTVGVTLHIKIGISAGEVIILLLGNDEVSCYLELGRAIVAVNKVEDFWEPGSVIMSPTAWCHCYRLTTRHIVLSDRKHVRVFAILDKSVQPYEYKHTLSKELSTTSLQDSVDSKEEGSGYLSANSESVKWLRRAFFDDVDDQTIHRLKTYIASPVMKKIEDHQKLEYLSEMRQITILFINLILKNGTSRQRTATLDQCFQVINSNSRQLQGCVSKVSLFDKGCTFLVLFGLPGLKHESDCAHALMCADQIRKDLSKAHISVLSIGVATGPTYCGVVGHIIRHEYTVIGPRVNFAARLMMYFPNKVTCDAETYIHSKLSKGNFINQPPTRVKGMAHMETIKEFRPSAREMSVTGEERSLIGRENEIEMLEKELSNFVDSGMQQHREAMVILGEGGIGRSKILNAVTSKAASLGVKVISTRLRVQDTDLMLKVVTNLLAMVFKFDPGLTGAPKLRQDAIEKVMAKSSMKDQLWIFNHILGVKFPFNRIMAEKMEIVPVLHDLLVEVLAVVAEQKRYLFAIDDADLIDEDSWQLLDCFGKSRNTTIAITIRLPITLKCQDAITFINAPTTFRLKLVGLLPHHITALSCQVLNVSKIPLRLDAIICEKSMGIPFWVELLLGDYVKKRCIRIIRDNFKSYREPMVSPAPKYLTERTGSEDSSGDRFMDEAETLKSVGEGEDSNFEEQTKGSLKNAQTICIFVQDASIDIGVPESIKGMIQARIGRLPEDAQMVIKTAAVMRSKQFLRKMLERVLRTNMDSRRVGEAFQNLATARFFTCATKVNREALTAASGIAPKASGPRASAPGGDLLGEADTPTCVCQVAKGDLNEKQMRYCRYINFQSTFIRDAAYETLTEDVRRALHLSAAQFLEAQARKCLMENAPCTPDDLFKNFFLPDESDATLEDYYRPSTMNEQLNVSRTPSMSESRRSTTPLGDNLLKAKKSSSGRLTGLRQSQMVPALSERRGTMALDHVFGIQTKTADVSDLDALEGASEHSVAENLSAWRSLRAVSSIYPEIIEHFKGSGSVRFTVVYLLEAAAAHLVLFDHRTSYGYLRILQGIFNDLRKGLNPFKDIVAQTDNWTYGELDEAHYEGLVGLVLMLLNDRVTAMIHFRRSLRITGCKLTSMGSPHRLLLETFTQWRHRRSPHRNFGHYTFNQMRRLAQQSECLWRIFDCNFSSGAPNAKARRAANMEVNRAEKVDDEPTILLVAYTNMLRLCHFANNNKNAAIYLRKGIMTVAEVLGVIHPYNLITVGRHYWRMFDWMLNTTDLQRAIPTGTIAHQYYKNIEVNRTMVDHLPVFIQVHIALLHFSEAIEILNGLYQPELGREEFVTNNLLARCWYTYCCVELILNVGVALEPRRKCVMYAEKLVTVMNVVASDRLPFFALASSLCAMYQRVDDQEGMFHWRGIANKYHPTEFDTCYLSALAGLRLVEAKLIALARLYALKSPTREAIRLRRGLTSQVNRDLSRCAGLVKHRLIAKPRFLLMQAYWAAIRGRRAPCRALIERSMALCRNAQNYMELERSTKYRDAWLGTGTSEAVVGEDAGRDLWMEHAMTIMPRWTELEDGKCNVNLLYTLPLF